MLDIGVWQSNLFLTCCRKCHGDVRRSEDDVIGDLNIDDASRYVVMLTSQSGILLTTEIKIQNVCKQTKTSTQRVRSFLSTMSSNVWLNLGGKNVCHDHRKPTVYKQNFSSPWWASPNLFAQTLSVHLPIQLSLVALRKFGVSAKEWPLRKRKRCNPISLTYKKQQTHQAVNQFVPSAVSLKHPTVILFLHGVFDTSSCAVIFYRHCL